MGEKIFEVLASDGKSHYSWAFFCPGCEMVHQCDNRWGWNGSKEAPTFEGSVLVRWNYGEEKTPHCCHSFVVNGQIQYLIDCTHHLAGQTIDIPDWKGFG